MLLQIKSHLRVHTNIVYESEAKKMRKNQREQDYFVIVSLKLW